MNPLYQPGAKVSFDDGANTATGIVVRINTDGHKLLGISYIIRPDERIGSEAEFIVLYEYQLTTI